jgi:hypothetical protein
VLETWSYRWASEIFHEFGKQVYGLESAQVRKEEAVTRHFRLSCVAQSVVQCAPAGESTSERYAFAAGKKTYGQRCRAIHREVLRSLLQLSKRYFAEGKSCNEVWVDAIALDPGRACLTTHKPSSTFLVDQKGRLKFLFADGTSKANLRTAAPT